MGKFTDKILFANLSFGLVFSVVMGLIVFLLVPSFNILWLFATALFFFVVQNAVFLYINSIVNKKNSKIQLAQAYLLTKTIKILLALMYAGISVLIMTENKKVFLIVFVVFYVSYLIVESFLFMKIEKHIKNLSKK